MTETTTSAATIRESAPGRSERTERTAGDQQSSADFARTIRDSAPGRN